MTGSEPSDVLCAALNKSREACERARWPEQHRDDCAWCAHQSGGETP